MTVVAGEGLRLRRATEGDLPFLLAPAARPEVADLLAADPHDEGRFVRARRG
ncbi:MAG: hypothetical protein IT201_13835 [Thermoleophilia bacterium]|nr:hypothetical protein [Thermoleophilia bacterium]